MVTTVPIFGRWTDLPLQGRTPLHCVPHRETAARLRERLPWWSVNSIAGYVLKAMVLEMDPRAADALSILRMAHDLRYLLDRLRSLPGITADPSHASFVCIELPIDKIGSNESSLRLAVLPRPPVERLAGQRRSPVADRDASRRAVVPPEARRAP